MADQKISELTNITGANLANADEFVVVDVSADQTKAVTRSEFFEETPSINVTGNITTTGDVTIGDDLFITGPNPKITIRNTRSDSNWDVEPLFGSLDWFKNDGSGAGTGVMSSIQVVSPTATGAAAEMVFSIGTGVTNNFEAMRIDSAGNVGIGTSSPSADLEIASDNANIQLTDTDDSGYSQIRHNTGSLIFEADKGNTTATSAIRFDIDGAEHMRIDSAGNVGIGTSSPEADLHVNSGAANLAGLFESTDAGVTITLIDNSTTGGSAAEHGLNAVGDQLELRAVDNLSFETAATERMCIDSSGNVGIGTSSPSQELDVVGSIQASTFFQGGADGTASAPLFRLNDANTGFFRPANNEIGFTTDGSERMRIGAGGNVGIGTSSPDQALHVQDSGTDAAGTIQMGSDYYGYVQQLNNNLNIISNGDQAYRAALGTNNGTGNIVFQTASATTGNTERMRIEASGNLLVGKTLADGGATAGFEVTTNGRINATRDGSISGVFNRLTSDGSVVQLRKDGTAVGSISVTASATAYNTSSDYRLKENITPIQGAADVVMAMQPCTYTAIADGLWYDGFLAHELQEVHPRAVQGTKDAMMDEEYEITPAVYEDVITPAVEAVAATYDDEGIELTPAVEATPEITKSVLVTEAVMGTRSVPDMQSVDYSKLTPILTAALQEALTKIDALETRITSLEG